MLIRILLLVSCLLGPFLGLAQRDTLAQQLRRTKWKEQRIAPRTEWRQYHFQQKKLLGNKQNVNILVMPLRSRKLRYDLGSAGQKLIPTSTLGKNAQALAALNGTFFDTKNGGSVDLIKVDGQVFDTTRWSKVRAEHQRAAIGINHNQFQVIKGDSIGNWDQKVTAEDLMVTGPLLIYDGKIEPLSKRPFNTTRHPRTCLGITKNKKVLWITVDGRAQESAGMDLFELAQFMKALGCVAAINLDGGGSTTLWIDGKTETGVVNMPCDDKKFDQYGERPVSNVLLLFGKRK
jgi:exopolysaccharide biosynthesis protein